MLPLHVAFAGYSLPLKPMAGHARRCHVLADDYADESFMHANPAMRNARQEALAAQLAQPDTQPTHFAPIPRKPTKSAKSLDASEAFEKGLLMGFAMASGLPAVPGANFDFENAGKRGDAPCVIKLFGVGGGGGNTLNRVAQLDLGVERENCIEYVACNTDSQALDNSLAETKIQIGSGLGAGGKPAVGEEHAIESTMELYRAVKGADMVFVTAGMGGGTGSGAAPVVADLAKQAGCLTIGIVTTPFAFEGQVRMRQAMEAIDKFEQHTDILIVVSNDRLLEIVPDGLPIEEAFLMADEIMRQGITGVADIVIKPGLINVDFADVRSVMQGAGRALMGIGRGFGPDRARDAALAAVSSPLLDFPVADARGVVFTITGNSDMSLQEVNEVASLIGEMVSEDANIIFGTSIDESYGDEIAVTIVATGFPEVMRKAEAAAAFNAVKRR